MKVKCLFNTGNNLSEKGLKSWTKQSEMNLVINKEYIVYSIVFFKNDLWLYLLTDKYLKPFWYPDEIFRITDNKLSCLWYFMKFDETYDIQAIWGYDELINIENHYDNLQEREPDDMEIFYKRKKEMDMEFADDSIKVKASIVDQNLLMCPNCIDAWESTSIFGMVECSKCKTVMHNPRYKKL